MRTLFGYFFPVLLLISVHAEAGSRVPRPAGSGRPRDPGGPFHGTFQREAIRSRSAGRFETVDSLKVLVLRVSFSDREFSTVPVPYDSVYFANELRHLDEYFTGASRGRFSLCWELAPGVVRLDRPMGYYGEDGVWDERIVEMLVEIVEAADSAVNFARFEAFAVIHAGAGQETDDLRDSAEQIWSGFADPEEIRGVLADSLQAPPGVMTEDSLGGEPFYIDNLMVWPESASQDGSMYGSLGIYAYQIGLRIGLFPLIDTTPSPFPDSQGIGAFGLMGWGLYNAAGFIPAFPCAFHRYLMGWFDAVDVTGDGSIRLADINTAAPQDTSLVRIPISSTEYFLLANRVHDPDFDDLFDFIDVNGNRWPESEDTLLGAEFDYFLTSKTNPSYREEQGGGVITKYRTGSGLMVWHVDEWVILRALESGLLPEDNPALKGIDLEEADGVQDLDRPGGSYAFGSHFDSFREGSSDRFGPGTIPSSASNARVPTGIEVFNISEPALVMTFDVKFSLALDQVRIEIEGAAGGISPVAVDLDPGGGEELLVLSVHSDTGMVYVMHDAGAPEWNGSYSLAFEVPGARWTGPPVCVDVDGDDTLECFLASDDNKLHAYRISGTPYMIDDDGTPASLSLRGTYLSLPVALEIDGDATPEVAVLSSDDDTTFAYFIGYSSTLPGGDWRRVGAGIFEVPVAAGRLLSHPSAGSVTNQDGEQWEGMFFATLAAGGAARLHFIPLHSGQLQLDTIGTVSTCIDGVSGFQYLLTIASADVDRDGSDEMVAAVPGFGLVYYSPAGGIHRTRLWGARPSAPVLEDVDGDGVPETAVRDETSLYLFTGFGTLLDDWPIFLPDEVMRLEKASPPPSPVIADLDGDAVLEVLFAAGSGALHAYETSARPVAGWPVPGEGDGSESPAVVLGAADEVNIFAVGSVELLDGGIYPSSGTVRDRSSIRRYATGRSAGTAAGWRFFRRDIGGTGRWSSTELPGGPERWIDPETFISYPNPVTIGTFTVRIGLKGPADVRVLILNLEGEMVFERKRRHMWFEGSSVPFEETFNTAEMAGGIYIIVLSVSGEGWSWEGARKIAVIR